MSFRVFLLKTFVLFWTGVSMAIALGFLGFWAVVIGDEIARRTGFYGFADRVALTLGGL